MKKVLISIFLITFFLSFSFSNAQVQTSIDGINMTTNPEMPAQGVDVTVSIESFLVDLDSSSIVWQADGKTIGSGVGLKEIHITSPKTGGFVKVTAIVKSSDGKETRKTTTIKSGSVEIVWESKGYTPPFFKGRNSFTYQNEIKLVAIPHLSTNGVNEIKSSDLIYKWRMDGKYIDGGIGYGKQSVSIKADIIPKPLEISVEVYNRDQTEGATGRLSINPSEPSVEFYEMSSLYGILFNKALVRAVTLSNSEISIFAVPFGFNFNSRTSPLNYNWSINNVEQPDLIKNQSITLRTKGDTDGSSSIDVDIRNENEILQGARASLKINFKKGLVEQNNVTF